MSFIYLYLLSNKLTENREVPWGATLGCRSGKCRPHVACLLFYRWLLPTCRPSGAEKSGSLSNPVNSGGCDQYSHSHVLEIRQSERDALHVAQIIIQAFGYRIGYPSIGKCGN